MKFTSLIEHIFAHLLVRSAFLYLYQFRSNDFLYYLKSICIYRYNSKNICRRKKRMLFLNSAFKNTHLQTYRFSILTKLKNGFPLQNTLGLRKKSGFGAYLIMTMFDLCLRPDYLTQVLVYFSTTRLGSLEHILKFVFLCVQKILRYYFLKIVKMPCNTSNIFQIDVTQKVFILGKNGLQIWNQHPKTHLEKLRI